MVLWVGTSGDAHAAVHFGIISDLRAGRAYEGIVHASVDGAFDVAALTITLYRRGISPSPTFTVTTNGNGYGKSDPLLPPGDGPTLFQVDAATASGILLEQGEEHGQSCKRLVIAVPEQSRNVGTVFFLPRIGPNQVLLVGNPSTTDATVRIFHRSLSSIPTERNVPAKTVETFDLATADSTAPMHVAVTSNLGVIVQLVPGNGHNATLVLPVGS